MSALTHMRSDTHLTHHTATYYYNWFNRLVEPVAALANMFNFYMFVSLSVSVMIGERHAASCARARSVFVGVLLHQRHRIYRQAVSIGEHKHGVHGCRVLASRLVAVANAHRYRVRRVHHCCRTEIERIHQTSAQPSHETARRQ
jgi:hypothetical protein